MPASSIPICTQCKTNRAAKNSKYRAHSPSKAPWKRCSPYQELCSSCKKNPYAIHKKESCESCGFVPEWQGQLDVDHIDGNHSNNKLDNLKTLCANCHRLKTYLCKDSHESFNIEEEIPQLSLSL
jgi:hypothetical protein